MSIPENKNEELHRTEEKEGTALLGGVNYDTSNLNVSKNSNSSSSSIPIVAQKLPSCEVPMIPRLQPCCANGNLEQKDS